MFENLVISDKCKTSGLYMIPKSAFENLVISDKCKTQKNAMDSALSLRTL